MFKADYSTNVFRTSQYPNCTFKTAVILLQTTAAEVFTTGLLKIQVFWDVTPYLWLSTSRRFQASQYHYLKSQELFLETTISNADVALLVFPFVPSILHQFLSFPFLINAILFIYVLIYSLISLSRPQRSGDRIPVGQRFSAPVQTGPGAHPAFSRMGTGSFPTVKRLGRGVDHPPASNA